MLVPGGSLVGDGEGERPPVEEMATLTPLTQECRVMSSLPRLENILRRVLLLGGCTTVRVDDPGEASPMLRHSLPSVQYRQSAVWLASHRPIAHTRPGRYRHRDGLSRPPRRPGQLDKWGIHWTLTLTAPPCAARSLACERKHHQVIVVQFSPLVVSSHVCVSPCLGLMVVAYRSETSCIRNSFPHLAS